MNRIIFTVICVVLLCLQAQAADYTLTSPDGRISAMVQTADEISMQVSYQGKRYITIPHIQLITDKQTLGHRAKVRKATARSTDNIFRPVYGINSTVKEKYNELRIDFKGGYTIVFRAYDEGVAWRFATTLGKSLIVRDEPVDYQFAGNYEAWFHPAMSESDYRRQHVSDAALKPNYTSMPVLVKADDGIDMLLHESDVSNYPCMSLVSSVDKPNTLTAVHPFYPKVTEPGGYKNFDMVVKQREDYIARTSGTRSFPWRIIAFSHSDKDILSNQLVWLLGAGCKLQDTSWIKPGKVAWDWWHGLNLSGVNFHTGFNTDTYKYYIDFAAKHGIEYVNLDEGWSDPFDLTKITSTIDMPELARYARNHGVGLILWCVWHTLDKQMDEAMAQFEKWGIAGLKVDFLDRDDQQLVDFEERTLQAAARHHLLVNFHGAYHPNGLERAYPNNINVEGVKGLEWDKINEEGATPDNAVTIPFIRMFAGPMDYTPGAMENYNRDEWRMIKLRPMSQGTRCQQLAMYVVYNGPLQMLADSPTAYDREPQYIKFLSSIPTVWDETRPIDGHVGEYVSVARRKGGTWFVGGMTNWTPRTQTLRLSFLKPGVTYVADIVSDGLNAARVGSDYVMSTKEVKLGDSLTFSMAPGGGYAVRLTPKSDRHDIVVFGDSRVQMGGDWGKLLGREHVVNAGIGGFTTSHFIWLVKPYVIERHPRVCLLEGGSNDIGAGIPLERIKRNYRSLVDTLLTHGINVIMHAVTYPTEKDPTVQQFKVEMTDSLDAFIHQLAREKGLPCVDLNPLLTENKRLKADYARDNVHFTPAGYTIWAREVNRILKEKNW
uniref:glycoside hydrolase family 97 catalytic domain-containing protein n=1 Tax=Prevotella sp. TaxID=59823 RepID=UPI0040285DC2